MKKDQLKKIIVEVLLESKLSKITNVLERETFNFLNRSLEKYKKDSKKYEKQIFENVYSYPLRFRVRIIVMRDINAQHDVATVSGQSSEKKNTSYLDLIITLNPEDEPQVYNTIRPDIKGFFRHELEHKIQFGMNKVANKPILTAEEDQAYINALDRDDIYSYFVNKLEVPAYVKQMYAVAKTKKISFQDQCEHYLNNAMLLDYINDDEKNKILEVWYEYAKKELPALNLESKGNQLVTLLLEIKLDGFVSQISNSIMNFIRQSREWHIIGMDKKIGPLDKSTGYRIKRFADYETPINFTLYFAIQRTNKVSKIGFVIDANSGDFNDDPNILLSVTLDPNQEPKVYSTLLGYIKDVLRHELEHMTQVGINQIEGREKPELEKIRAKINKSKTDKYKYFLLRDEIPAMVKGMETRAKYEKKPIDLIFSEYLDYFIEQNMITEEQKSIVMKVWIDYVKKHLPLAKLS
jgi:hypothetical protein